MDMEDAGIRRAVGFDQSDLESNRMGVFSEKQKKALAKDTRSTNVTSLIFGLVLLFVSVLPFFILWLSGALAFFGWLSLIWGIWTVAWGAIGIGLILGATEYQKLSLRKAVGPVNIIVEQPYPSKYHQTAARYELRLSGEKFDVGADLGNYMAQGDVFAIYYVDETRKILSVEWLAKGK
jgi:hypothetical protein